MQTHKQENAIITCWFVPEDGVRMILRTDYIEKFSVYLFFLFLNSFKTCITIFHF